MNAETTLRQAVEYGRRLNKWIRCIDYAARDNQIGLSIYIDAARKLGALPSSEHELRLAGEFALADGHELPPSLLELWALHGKQVREAKRLDRALKIRAKLAELGALVFVGVCYFGVHHTALTCVLEIAGVL